MLTLDPNDLGAALWAVSLWSAGFLGLFFYLYRTRIISVFDPLVGLAVAQAAYSVMGVALIHSGFLLVQFLASQAALIIGFLLVRKPRLEAGEMIWTTRDTVIAEWTVFLLFLLLLAANIWLGATAGFPLFADDPSAAKFTVYAGGLGLVRRINEGVGVFVSAGSLLLALRGKHKALFRILFIFCMLLASLSGSKGALLFYLQLIALVVYRKNLISDSTAKRLRLFSIVLLIAGIFLGVAVLYIVAKDWSLAATGFLQRIILQGDSIIYYYDPRVFPHFVSYGPWDYVYMLLNPLLGGLRLVPYQEPIGYQMVKYYLGSSLLSDHVLGPNTPFFLAGHIYFGSFFGIFYCGFVGYIVARVRTMFFEARNASPLRLIWLLSVGLLVYNFPVEVNLFTGPLLDMFVMVCMAVVAAHILLFILGSTSKEGRPFVGKKIAWSAR